MLKLFLAATVLLFACATQVDADIGQAVSPGNLDASKFAVGSDMCAQIAAATALIPATQAGLAVIDGRVFNATRPCAASMFASVPAGSTGKILLGNVSLQTDVPQNPPTQWSIEGVTPYYLQAPTFTAIGTVIQPSNNYNTNGKGITTILTNNSTSTGTACTTAPPNSCTLKFASTAGIQVGDGLNGTANIPFFATVESVTGTAVQMSDPVTGTVASGTSLNFVHPLVSMGCCAVSSGVQVSHLRITCIAPNGSIAVGSIGLQNNWAQQQSGANHIAIDGCYNGLSIDGAGNGSGAQNGGPYDNIAIGAAGLSTANAICARFGSATGTTAILETSLRMFSCNAIANGSAQTYGVLIDGAMSLSFYDSNVEQVITGFAIAHNGNVGGINIEGIQCSGLSGTPMTTCIDLRNDLQNIESFMLVGLSGYSTDNVTNRLVDHANGNTITSPVTKVAYYAVENSRVSGLSSGIASILGKTTFAGTIPTTPSSCGTTPTMTADSTNNRGQVTTGTGAPTGCTINFAETWPKAPICTVVSQTSGVGLVSWTSTTTTLVITLGAGTSNAKLNYSCF